mmetsp:Transcript_5883/g.18106  ORF Transcript_5883/g.18106 Transcript_5883/m.18106 type:complete len:85 (-) Transcript_5883:1187-1441(-)|eukprot:scaffold200269_cov32-Tisochrysis_lutea.AAC.5
MLDVGDPRKPSLLVERCTLTLATAPPTARTAVEITFLASDAEVMLAERDLRRDKLEPDDWCGQWLAKIMLKLESPDENVLAESS